MEQRKLTLREIRAVALYHDLRSPAEIAARFGVSRTAIQNRLARARAKRPDLVRRVSAVGRHVQRHMLSLDYN